jgi:hypothetical protein
MVVGQSGSQERLFPPVAWAMAIVLRGGGPQNAGASAFTGRRTEMAELEESAEVAAAIRELAKQVGALGNAVMSAVHVIAKAISDGIEVQVGQRPGPP